MEIPYKFVYIWTNGAIVHCIAYRAIDASQFIEKHFQYITEFAYIIKRIAIEKDFHEPNVYLVGGVAYHHYRIVDSKGNVREFAITKNKTAS